MRRFGELEAVIMDRLWEWGRPVLVREVVDDLRDERGLAYTTVMTVMENLYRKGWLRRERDGRAWRYEPTGSRSGYTAGRRAIGGATRPGRPRRGRPDAVLADSQCRSASSRHAPRTGQAVQIAMAVTALAAWAALRSVLTGTTRRDQQRPSARRRLPGDLGARRPTVSRADGSRPPDVPMTVRSRSQPP